MPRTHRSIGVLFATTALLCMGSRAVTAQSSLWTEVSALGYGGLGVGAAALTLDHLYAFDTRLYVAAALGLVAGYLIGGEAESAAREGRMPNGHSLWGTRMGTVAGFATLGAAAAGIFIATTEGNATGEDERRLTLWSALGGAVGVLTQVAAEKDLSPRGAVTPTFSVSSAPHGGLSLGATWAFR